MSDQSGREADTPDLRRIDIGIFAHNEAGNIAHVLDTLLAQDLFRSARNDVQVHVLANGCTDATVPQAEAHLAAQHPEAPVTLHNLSQGGKSRTWNQFVHDLSRSEADFVFMDADIDIPDPAMLSQLLELLWTSPQLSGVSSRPVKDIAHDPSLARGPLDGIIAAAGGGLGNWKSSICGQLYCLRGPVARGIHLPVGLPVEDGFVRAMVQTDRFRTEGAPETALDGKDELFHIYESERGLGALLRHQTRIVIGSAINFAIFDDLRRRPAEEIPVYLDQISKQDGYLSDLIAAHFPNRRFGYVPWHFLIKRLSSWKTAPNRFRPKRLIVTGLGLCFDAIVFIRAQYAMLRGAGAGYW